MEESSAHRFGDRNVVTPTRSICRRLRQIPRACAFPVRASDGGCRVYAHLTQDSANRRKRTQEGAARRLHMRRMRNKTAPIRRRFQWRTKMQIRIASTLRASARRALLPALAVVALFSGLPAAYADQQETNAQIDNRLNWEAASGTGVPGAYAQVIRPGRTHVRGYTYR
jgi:hypothetical protein